MPKTIQELRRERGYRSAREFADALGISPSSMSRYDNQPESIPTKVAWEMADKLGCSIDEVVGRKPVASGASELQEFYDGLSPEGRALFDEFREFVSEKEERAKKAVKSREDRKYERMAQFYERMFYRGFFDHVDVEDLDALDQPWAARDGIASLVGDSIEDSRARRADKAVQEHIKKLKSEGKDEGAIEVDGVKADPGDDSYEDLLYLKLLRDEKARIERDEPSIEEVTEKVMEAYDRLHPEDRDGYEYAYLRLPK